LSPQPFPFWKVLPNAERSGVGVLGWRDRFGKPSSQQAQAPLAIERLRHLVRCWRPQESKRREVKVRRISFVYVDILDGVYKLSVGRDAAPL